MPNDEQTAPSKDERLEPCPFCGGAAGACNIEEGNVVECCRMDCYGVGRAFDTREEAIAAWNRRSSEPTTEPQTFEEWERGQLSDEEYRAWKQVNEQLAPSWMKRCRDAFEAGRRSRS